LFLARLRSFSALQRAENFSIAFIIIVLVLALARFSALQRAENFSILHQRLMTAADAAFQCSSASRKFLNLLVTRIERGRKAVSVLFSEPKISQLHVP